MSEKSLISKNAIIGENVVLGDGVRIDPFAIIKDNVKIGNNTYIGSHSVICERTEIGNDCRIFSHSAIGTAPQDTTSKDENDTKLVIGDRNYVYEFVTISKGTSKDNKITRIGNGNMLMAKVHVGHDCLIGNNCVFSNGIDLAGHVKIEDNCFIGASVRILQWIKIGELSMINSNAGIYKDTIPFLTSDSDGYVRINLIGLKRNGYSKFEIEAIRNVYEIIISETIIYQDKINKIRLFLDSETDEKSKIVLQKIMNSIENSSKYGAYMCYAG